MFFKKKKKIFQVINDIALCAISFNILEGIYEMRNIKLTIEYDGKDFNGWQKQPNKPNIQGSIEFAIKQITGEEVELNASGRTDAGVHSWGQVANFKTESNLPIEKFPIAINTKLKRSIRIINAEEVDERFHSRLSCKRKTYRYVINNSEVESAIYRNLETYIPQKLNIEKMKEAVKYFEGEHDFKAFKASGTSSKSSVRIIYNAEVIEKGLGYDIGSFGANPKSCMIIDISNPKSHEAHMPWGVEPGTNVHWVPGGYTEGMATEAVAYNIKNPDVVDAGKDLNARDVTVRECKLFR